MIKICRHVSFEKLSRNYYWFYLNRYSNHNIIETITCDARKRMSSLFHV